MDKYLISYYGVLIVGAVITYHLTDWESKGSRVFMSIFYAHAILRGIISGIPWIVKALGKD
jgi:hypothetical protein